MDLGPELHLHSADGQPSTPPPMSSRKLKEESTGEDKGEGGHSSRQARWGEKAVEELLLGRRFRVCFSNPYLEGGAPQPAADAQR